MILLDAHCICYPDIAAAEENVTWRISYKGKQNEYDLHLNRQKSSAKGA